MTEFHIGDETPKTTSSLENLRRTTDCHVKPLNRKHLGLNFNGRFYENKCGCVNYYYYYVLRSRRNCSSDGAERTDDARAFHARAAVTGKARSPSVVRHVVGQCRRVMVQTMSDAVNECSVRKLHDGGLQRLHSADDVVVNWLTTTKALAK